ncbi:hypothetical protein HD553DRAFT_314180 [Filobasidium floriforme]|uniref:uncharacterized protein n=1 Tax=Filobasidium floriforme TaxID=5210 RepID=UPI001E8DD0E3|nr:uncharacterized protein HD553DRAFT_314180 [Filobasidium floriforme]KAH8082769.1 hypothetical protein HD553DRAFT_314180 [Filobasidium floriforme]
MRILDLRHLKGWATLVDRLPFLIAKRVAQLESSASILGRNWRHEGYPHLKTIKASGRYNTLVGSLLPLFHVEGISFDGWDYRHFFPANLGIEYCQSVTLNIHPNSRWTQFRNRGLNVPRHASLKINIAIGWHEPHHTEPLLSKEGCARTAQQALEQLDRFGVLDKPIVFSPYLGNGGHRFCFPTQKPQAVKEADYHHSPIEFQSPCNCGMGDLTGIWEAIEARIRTWMQGRPVNVDQ